MGILTSTATDVKRNCMFAVRALRLGPAGTVALRADVRDDAHLETVDPSVVAIPSFELEDRLAAMACCQQVLGAFLDVTHRSTELPRKVGDEDFFRCERQLQSEATADVGGDDAHMGLR